VKRQVTRLETIRKLQDEIERIREVWEIFGIDINESVAKYRRTSFCVTSYRTSVMVDWIHANVRLEPGGRNVHFFRVRVKKDHSYSYQYPEAV